MKEGKREEITRENNGKVKVMVIGGKWEKWKQMSLLRNHT